MISLVVVAHSRALATDVVALARQMASPDVRFAIAAGVGENHSELGTDTAEIAQAIETVFSPDGVLVLMDLGSAVLGAETALDLLPGEMREHVRLCPAPLVEGALAAAVQAGLGADLDAACQEACEALGPKYEYLATNAGVRHLEGVGHLDQHLNLVVTLNNPHGLHARPAARFVQTAARFDATVSVQKIGAEGEPVGASASARSVNQLAILGGQRGDRLRISAEGPQASEALDALRELVESRFGEADAEAAPRSAPVAAPSATHERIDGLGLPVRAIPVSEGIAIGVAAHQHMRLPVIGDDVGDDGVEDVLAEQRRLDDAIERVGREIELRRQRIGAGAGEDRAAIFDAHLLILKDDMLAGQARQLVRERHYSAAKAWHSAVAVLAEAYRALPDAYLRQRAQDVIDVGAQVLAQLGQVSPA